MILSVILDNNSPSANPSFPHLNSERHIYKIRHCILGSTFNISICYRNEAANKCKNKYCIFFLLAPFPEATTVPLTQIIGQSIYQTSSRIENCCTQTCCIQTLCSATERSILLPWELCFDFKLVLVPFSQICSERFPNTAHYYTCIPTCLQLTTIHFFHS